MENPLKRPLRVAFVDYVLEPDKPGRTGLSDIVWDMATELVNQGHEAHVIASYHTDQYPDSRVIVHNFPTPPIGYQNVVGHFLILREAAKIVQKLKLDIIHTPEYVAPAVLISLGVKTPIVFTVPGNIFHRIKYGSGYEWYYEQILKWAARVAAKKSAKVIAISQEMKRWWEWTGSAPENTPVIPYGVDQNRFYPIPDARKKLGLSENKLIFLYAGRFSPEKGLMDLIKAVSLLDKEIREKNMQLFLLGKGSLLNEMNDFVIKNELESVIRIQDWVTKEQLAVWYSAADAYVLPSYSEGFSRNIPEALSCGTPIIGSKITGTEDHIIENLNGFLFLPGNVDAITALFKNFISCPDTLRELRIPARNYAQANFPWRVIVERIVQEVYIPPLDC